MYRKNMLSKGWVVITGILMLIILRTSPTLADPCQANINGDGNVDFKDLKIIKAEEDRDNCYTVPCRADLNGDGKVDIEDRKIFKAELGRKDCLSINGNIVGEDIAVPQIRQETEPDIAEEDEELEEEVTPPTTRFKDHGNGTVTDLKTGLMWTKNANPSGDTMLFPQALGYIEGMNEGKYPNFGYTDWRLPNLNELRSLVDYTRPTVKGHVLPSGHPFQNIQSLKFYDMSKNMSSTTYLSNSKYPRFASLYCRIVGHNVKSCYGYVWPVRGSQ